MLDTLTRIENLIKEKGWSKSEFLRRLGLPTNAFGEWKRGKHKSYIKHIEKIAIVLDTTSDYLLCKTDDPSPTPLEISREKGALTTILRREGVIPDGRALTTEEYNQLIDIAKITLRDYKRIQDEESREKNEE